jgi:hypothetical protein
MPQTAAHFEDHIEEHELPSVEAVLAGTLALMTGYSQALQAELDPQGRIAMGEKVGSNLGLLLDHPQLSLGFRQVLFGLQQRWIAMNRCTVEATPTRQHSQKNSRQALTAKVPPKASRLH